MRNYITEILKDIATLLELKGENKFKVAAYLNASRTISDLGIDIERKVKDNTLDEINGIGTALKEKLTELINTGKMDFYEKLKEEVPDSLFLMSKINGIGPKKARDLYYKHNISSIKQLKEKAENNQLQKLTGFGEKSELQILKAINDLESFKGKFRLDKAYDIAKEFLDLIKNFDSIRKISIAGELQRWDEIIEKIRFIVLPSDFDIFIDEIKSKFDNFKLINENTIEIEFLTNKVLLEIANENSFVCKLIKHSSSEEFLNSLNEFIDIAGFKIEKDILLKNNQEIELSKESDFFNKIGLQYIPPTIRENSQTLQFAASGSIPELISENDMKGMLHCHSKWSDGLNTIEEMALAAKNLSYSYFAICDHSKSATYANGLSIDRVLEQHQEIDELNNKNLGIKILKGIESDILPDGSLDYPEEILEKFDLVVASIHSNFNMGENEMTDRITRALMSPYTTILGHPTGRLLLRRKEYNVDMYAVVDAAIENNKIIEINANPHRLDINWRFALYGKQKGLKIAINPDAHNIKGLNDVFYGIKIAQKAWLQKNDVVNTYPYELFKRTVLKK